jgi:hypothetical protein
MRMNQIEVLKVTYPYRLPPEDPPDDDLEEPDDEEPEE